MKREDDHCWLFNISCQGLRYFLLALVGFAIAYIFSVVFNASLIVDGLLMLWGGLWRIAVMIFCFMGAAIVTESLQ